MTMKTALVGLTALTIILSAAAAAQARPGGGGSRGGGSGNRYSPAYPVSKPNPGLLVNKGVTVRSINSSIVGRSMHVSKGMSSMRSTKISLPKPKGMVRSLPKPKKFSPDGKKFMAKKFKGKGKYLAMKYKKFKYRWWFARYGVYAFWSPDYDCWYYYCNEANGYLPVSEIGSDDCAPAEEMPDMEGGLPPLISDMQGDEGLPAVPEGEQ
jgi:hypothetical protein